MARFPIDFSYTVVERKVMYVESGTYRSGGDSLANSDCRGCSQSWDLEVRDYHDNTVDYSCLTTTTTIDSSCKTLHM